MTARDPMKTRYDALDHIGACDCGPASLVGAGFDINLSGSAKAELDALSKKADKAIGQAAGAYANAAAQVDSAIAVGGDIEAAVKELDQTGNDIADAVVAVAANPLTHVALGAVAVAAPPFSTVAAGIAEAALGVAVVATQVVKAIEDVWNDIFMTYTQKAARAWGVSEAEAQRIIDLGKEREDFRKSFQENAAAAETQLAALKEAAASGDKDSVAAMAALDTLMRSDILLLTTVLRFGCTPEVMKLNPGAASKGGLTPKQLCDVARVLLKDAEFAGSLSEKDFKFYRDGSTRWNLNLTEGTKGSTATFWPDSVQLIDKPTGKVIAVGEKARKYWQNTIDPVIDPVTRLPNLALVPGLKDDYAIAFRDSLLKNWQKLDKAATLRAEKAVAERAAKNKAEKEKAELNAAIRAKNKESTAKLIAEGKKKTKAMQAKGIPVVVGDKAKGILLDPTASGWKSVGYGTWRITTDRSEGPRTLITKTGRMVRSYFEKAS